MKKVRKQAANRAIDWEEFAELRAFQYRIEGLLELCEGFAIGMNEDRIYEVWGKLRWVEGAEMVRLATVPGDLREAVRQAWMAADALEQPYRIQVGPFLPPEATLSELEREGQW